MPIEDIAHLLGHGSARVPELLCRKEPRPVLTRAAKVTDQDWSDCLSSWVCPAIP
jgi:hypothetical protein